MEQIVEREIDQLGIRIKEENLQWRERGLSFYECGESRVAIIREYLNNFHLKMPDGNDQSGYGSWYRELYHNHWEVKHRESKNNFGSYSGLFLDQSPKEFYEAVDLAIGECGISRAEITKMLECSNGRPKEIVLPVFIKLREMGYDRRDLTG